MTVSKEILDIFHKYGENLSNIEFFEELREQIIKEETPVLQKTISDLKYKVEIESQLASMYYNMIVGDVEGDGEDDA